MEIALFYNLGLMEWLDRCDTGEWREMVSLESIMFHTAILIKT